MSTIQEVIEGKARWCVIQGDCLEVLRALPESTFDFVMSDVPYGLGSHEPTPDEVLAFLSGGALRTGDFMGAKWQIPSVEVWREVLRVAKPGAHCFSFGGTRTWDLISMGLRMAGWSNRDTIAHDHPALRWVQASGMAKGQRVGKAIDRVKGAVRKVVGKRKNNKADSGVQTYAALGAFNQTAFSEVTAPATPEAAEWEGFGSCLAPTWEPVMVFRKPLDGTLASNVLTHGCGALNIDRARTFTDWSDRPDSWKRSGHSAQPDAEKIAAPPGQGIVCDPRGRWPKNAVLSCFCPPDGHVEGCPVRLLDEQSGETRNGGQNETSDRRSRGLCFGEPTPGNPTSWAGDSGTASRFFPTFPADPPEPFFYEPKASRQEREIGCEALPAKTRGELSGRDDDATGQNNGQAGIRRKGAIRNHGKCVKPQGVLRWLARLGCRPGGLVLVPYCGTGSEMIACVVEGMRVVGIELDPEMIPIANARLAWWLEHPDLSDEAKAHARVEAAGQRSLFT